MHVAFGTGQLYVILLPNTTNCYLMYIGPNLDHHHMQQLHFYVLRHQNHTQMSIISNEAIITYVEGVHCCDDDGELSRLGYNSLASPL